MSFISLDLAKQYLNVIHDFDDLKLQMLLDGAEDEATQFIERTLSDLVEEDMIESSSEIINENTLPSSVVLAVMMLLQGAYQATPEDAEKLRKGAEIKLTPFRIGWGI